ncbi:MAG TPA: type II secretion system protein [Candidatus Paceibacterota bacterium]|nr:type II secretion system protein [Candidatus Paceibacterota bacterium]
MKRQFTVYGLHLIAKALRILHPQPTANHRQSTLPHARQRGFTLIELLVVIGIIIFIAALIMANTNRFGGLTTTQDLAYDMALSIREAQQYGISVSDSECAAFDCAFGIHIGSNPATSYNLFADTSHTGIYNNNDAAPTTYQLNAGYQISDLCVTFPQGNSDVETCGHTSLDLLFIRPDPEACISVDGSSELVSNTGKCKTTNPNYCARIKILSPNNDESDVVVTATGDISVVAPSANCL